MKRKLLIVLAFCFSFAFNVHAECSYKEQASLKQEANTIKASYEERPKMIQVEDGEIEDYYFTIKLLNLSDKFTVSITNNIDSKRMLYSTKDYNDGTLSFDHLDLSKVVTYTFKIYSTNRTSCAGELIKTIYLNVPRYNMYSGWGFCKDNKSHLCDKYVLTDEISIDEIRNKIEKEEAENKDNKSNSSTSKEKKSFNDVLIISVGAISILLVGGIVIFVNRKKASL